MPSKTANMAQKSTYKTPQVTEFGSVRNLTGGSAGSMASDGGGGANMSMMVV